MLARNFKILYPILMKKDTIHIIPEKEIEKRISSLQAKLGECNQVRFLGHGIGLVIDEFPALTKKIHYPLKENMIIAVEPKKGIKGVGLVGIENTFQVTPEGGKRLTPGLDEIRIL